MEEGYTPFGSALRRSYEYFSNRIKRHSTRSPKTRTKLIDINELACIKLLSPFFPAEADSMRIEFSYWMETFDKIVTLPMIAAKFLWLCRTNRLPVTLNEISNDFKIRPKIILDVLSETDSYIPPLSTIEYVHRISLQLSIPDKIRENAIYLVHKEEETHTLDGTSPILRACCNVLKSAKGFGCDLSISSVASILGISAAGIRVALKRLK